jgi:hypothetical protein
MAEERVQRRLAAILSADVVGYLRLMGIEETGTLARCDFALPGQSVLLFRRQPDALLTVL